MSSLILNNIFRFVVLVLIQVLLLKDLELGGTNFNYIQVYVYPVLLFLLPVNINRSYLLLYGFFLGLVIDMFYGSPGMHASACVFVAYVRQVILRGLEPRGGYNESYSPTKYRMGVTWFLRYMAIMLGIHLFFFFSVEAFSFAYLQSILLKTISSFIISFIVIGIYVFISNPKD